MPKLSRWGEQEPRWLWIVESFHPHVGWQPHRLAGFTRQEARERMQEMREYPPTWDKYDYIDGQFILTKVPCSMRVTRYTPQP